PRGCEWMNVQWMGCSRSMVFFIPLITLADPVPGFRNVSIPLGANSQSKAGSAGSWKYIADQRPPRKTCSGATRRLKLQRGKNDDRTGSRKTGGPRSLYKGRQNCPDHQEWR